MMKLKSKITIVAIIILLSIPLPILFFLKSKEHFIGFETISKRNYSGHAEKAFYVINSDDEFLNLWNKTVSVFSPRPEAPSIDFTITTVIAVYGGMQGSGSSIEVIKIITQNNKILVHYKIEHSVLTVISNPYHIIKTLKLTNEIFFIEI